MSLEIYYRNSRSGRICTANSARQLENISPARSSGADPSTHAERKLSRQVASGRRDVAARHVLDNPRGVLCTPESHCTHRGVCCAHCEVCCTHCEVCCTHFEVCCAHLRQVASGRRDVAARNGARLLQVARTRCKSVLNFPRHPISSQHILHF